MAAVAAQKRVAGEDINDRVGKEIICVQVGPRSNVIGDGFWKSQRQHARRFSIRPGHGLQSGMQLRQGVLFDSFPALTRPRLLRVARKEKFVMKPLPARRSRVPNAFGSPYDDEYSFQFGNLGVDNRYGIPTVDSMVDDAVQAVRTGEGGADSVRASSSDVGLPPPVCLSSEMTAGSFDCFTHGGEALGDSEFNDHLEDGIRVQLERCDNVGGFNFMVDCNGGFSGVALGLLDLVRDHCPTKPVLTWGMHFDAEASLAKGQSEVEELNTLKSVAKRSINEGLSLKFLSERSTVYVPIHGTAIENRFEGAPGVEAWNRTAELISRCVDSILSPPRFVGQEKYLGMNALCEAVRVNARMNVASLSVGSIVGDSAESKAWAWQACSSSSPPPTTQHGTGVLSDDVSRIIFGRVTVNSNVDEQCNKKRLDSWRGVYGKERLLAMGKLLDFEFPSVQKDATPSPSYSVVLDSSNSIETELRKVAQRFLGRPRAVEFEFEKGRGGLSRDELREIDETLLSLADCYQYT